MSVKDDMKEQIELLIKIGLTQDHAIAFIKNIADEAYCDGYSEGMRDKPAIIGETLGESGMDFYEWWGNKMKPLLHNVR